MSIGCEVPLYYVSLTGKSCKGRFRLCSLPELKPSSKLSSDNWRKICNSCEMNLNQTEPGGEHLDAPPSSLSRNVDYIPEGGRMLNAGKAVKVSIYLSEGSKHHGVPTYSSILDFLFYRGVSGATVLKGIAGFGADHHMHSASIVEISDHLPLKIEFIESREKVNELLGKLEELAGTGMIEIQETTLAKPAQVSKPKIRSFLRT